MASVGSRAYWRDPNSYPQSWEARAAQAGRLIAPGSTVLDVGCGPHMALRRHLPEGCVYRPADLYQWTSDVRAADIDANIFPEGTYDCVALLGVIEYLTKPQLAFSFARRCASAMVISYCYPLTDDLSPRQKVGWVNALSKVELAKLLAQHGWYITQSETFHRSPHTHQMIHALRKTE